MTIFEELHHVPLGGRAAGARRLLTPMGSVVIADELVTDVLTAPASDLERYRYRWSVVSSLPAAMGKPARPTAER